MAVRSVDAGLILVSLFLAVDLSVSWVVHMPDGPVYATAGSSIVLPCSYDFPEESPAGHHYKVLSEMWCLDQSHCITPRYVYHSAGIFPEPTYQGRVEYLGRLGSRNCSLRISELRVSDSGVYVFCFITDHPVAKLPGQRGLTLLVTVAESSKGSAVVWILGCLLAAMVVAGAALYCRRRSLQRS
ncbi:sialoadhesin isoform X2 [Clupea harengus]|uniref:Sialoadhesin isoform X2 n=1 Tax=Clupea harengus TaxID=7950 RepID=A0A6P8FYJ5_CLUHA|nr:sialoadhesin isoform X2 [Clupea harengus]